MGVVAVGLERHLDRDLALRRDLEQTGLGTAFDHQRVAAGQAHGGAELFVVLGQLVAPDDLAGAGVLTGFLRLVHRHQDIAVGQHGTVTAPSLDLPHDLAVLVDDRGDVAGDQERVLDPALADLAAKRCRVSSAQALDDLDHVGAVGADLDPLHDVPQHPGGIDDEADPLGERPPPRSRRPVLLAGDLIRVAEQLEVELLPLEEALLQLDRVEADAVDRHAELAEVGRCVPQRAHLTRSTAGERFGVERSTVQVSDLPPTLTSLPSWSLAVNLGAGLPSGGNGSCARAVDARQSPARKRVVDRSMGRVGLGCYLRSRRPQAMNHRSLSGDRVSPRSTS